MWNRSGRSRPAGLFRRVATRITGAANRAAAVATESAVGQWGRSAVSTADATLASVMEVFARELFKALVKVALLLLVAGMIVIGLALAIRAETGSIGTWVLIGLCLIVHAAASVVLLPAFALSTAATGTIEKLGVARHILQAALVEAVKLKPSLETYVIKGQLDDEASEGLRSGLRSVEKRILARRHPIVRSIMHRAFTATLGVSLERLRVRIPDEGEVTFPSVGEYVGDRIDDAVAASLTAGPRVILLLVPILEIVILVVLMTLGYVAPV